MRKGMPADMTFQPMHLLVQYHLGVNGIPHMVTFMEILTLDGLILLVDIIHPILDGMAPVILKMMDVEAHQCLCGVNSHLSRPLLTTMAIWVHMRLHPPSMEHLTQEHPDIRKCPHTPTQMMQATMMREQEVLQRVVVNVHFAVISPLDFFWTSF